MNNRRWHFSDTWSLYFTGTAILIDIAINSLLPDKPTAALQPAYTNFLWIVFLVYLVILIISFRIRPVAAWFQHYAPLVDTLVLVIGVWDLLTIKTNIISLPYISNPEQVLKSLVVHWRKLAGGTLFSLKLLGAGYFLGAGVGLLTGVLTGWSQRANYWIWPLVKLIGPIPAVAYIPVFILVFPTTFLSSLFLIAVTVWFPVTVMTASGIINVSSTYYEIVKTLGGGPLFLVTKVAIPAAMPVIFSGLFMGLLTSFLTLTMAEMVGTRAGLGWFINGKMPGGFVVVIIVFAGLVTLLFKTRDYFLAWQKGFIRW